MPPVERRGPGQPEGPKRITFTTNQLKADPEGVLPLLVAQEQGRLVTWATRITHDRQAAQDLVQEGWIRLAGALPTMKPSNRDPMGYLTRIIRNLHIDNLRAGREVLLGDPLGDETSALTMQASSRTMGTSDLSYADPGEIAGANAGFETVRASIKELSPREREAILLKIQGNSPTQVAEALDTDIVTACSYLFRARYSLGAALEGPEERESRDELGWRERVTPALVDDLPDRQRAVTLLKLEGELSEPKIADALDMAHGTVKSHFFSARRNLLAELEASWMEGVTPELLSALPGREGEVARLKLEGLSRREIANALGMSIRGVRVSFAHARRNLSEMTAAARAEPRQVTDEGPKPELLAAAPLPSSGVIFLGLPGANYQEALTRQRMSVVPWDIRMAGAALDTLITENPAQGSNFENETSISGNTLNRFRHGEAIVDLNRVYADAARSFGEDGREQLRMLDRFRQNQNWLRAFTHDDMAVARSTELMFLQSRLTETAFADQGGVSETVLNSLLNGTRFPTTSEANGYLEAAGVDPDSMAAQYYRLACRRRQPMSINELQTIPLGRLMRNLRLMKGLEVEGLSDSIGYERTKIDDIEKGSNVQEHILAPLMAALGVTEDSAMGRIIQHKFDNQPRRGRRRRQPPTPPPPLIPEGIIEDALADPHLLQEHVDQIKTQPVS